MWAAAGLALPRAASSWSQVPDLPLKPGCLSNDSLDFKACREQIWESPWGTHQLCAWEAHAPTLVPAPTPGNSGLQNPVPREEGEGWGQRTSFEPDPLRQRSHAGIPGTPAGWQRGPGCHLPAFPLSGPGRPLLCPFRFYPLLSSLKTSPISIHGN